MRAVYPTKTFPNHYTIVTVSENLLFFLLLTWRHGEESAVPIFPWGVGTRAAGVKEEREGAGGACLLTSAVRVQPLNRSCLLFPGLAGHGRGRSRLMTGIWRRMRSHRHSVGGTSGFNWAGEQTGRPTGTRQAR